MNTDKNNTERLSYLAHELRLCNFSKKCGAVIHQAQVDKPSYLDFLCSLFTQELADREAYKRRRLHSLAQLPWPSCPGTATWTILTSAIPPALPNRK